MERVRFSNLRRRVSWGSIFGGVVTVMAVSILLAILATAISFFMLDPTDSDPASGIGTNVGIWTVVALVVSFAAGGFVAGKLAGADGYIHGFLVWAITTILTLILTLSLVSSAVKLAGNALGSVSSVAGNVLSDIGSGVSNLADQADGVFGNIDLSDEIDDSNVRQDIRQALRKSGVKELQPEYIQGQLSAIKSDLQRSLKRLATNPNDAETVINQFLERTKNRADRAFADVNRDDISRALANNTNLSRTEADHVVNEYTELINNMRHQARQTIESLQQNVADAKQNWEEIKVSMREEANDIANAAGRSALWSFIALLVGGTICAFMGHYGTRKTREGVEA